MEYIILKRLERNIKAVNRKYREFLEIQTGNWNGERLNNINEINDLTYQITMELITWIINTDQLLFDNFQSYKKAKKNEVEINYTIYGVRHAFNLFKHDMAILSLEDKRHIPWFKTEENEYFIEQTIWLDVSEIPVKEGHKDARKAYVDNLQNHTLKETFDDVISFLNKQYNIILANLK